jgi:protein TonB
MIAYVLQFLLLGVLVLVPLLRMEALPTWWLASPLVPPPSGGSPARSLVMKKNPRHTNWDERLKEPASIPKAILMVQEEPLAPQEGAEVGPIVPGAIPGGPPGGVPFGLGENANWWTPAPPPPQPKPANTQPIHIGGHVIEAKLIYHPDPVYPPLARMARIQGTVLLVAIIGKDGTIQELKVLGGHPLLARAAVDAVQHWRYQPTLLNGEPVEVLTEISVRFTLAD